MSRTAWDVIVVGGGILGLSTAMEITRRHSRKRVLVLEKEAGVGRHQSLHNSGVIHAGLYYRPGSLKAKTCVEGAAAMVRFAQEHGIDHEICGKVVVATTEAEIPRLEELRRRGEANGIENIAVLGPEELREIEPHTRGVKALRVPSTGIIDYNAVVRAYARLITAGGQRIQTSAQVTGIAVAGGEKRVETTAGDFAGKLIVNCAGLYADRVAKLAGGAPPMKIVPFRGEYYELTPERRSLVKSLIYPVPDPAFPFLGVHFTRRVNGSVEAGPNAVSLHAGGLHENRNQPLRSARNAHLPRLPQAGPEVLESGTGRDGALGQQIRLHARAAKAHARDSRIGPRSRRRGRSRAGGGQGRRPAR